ncbi:MAG: DUF4249 family protein [Flavobacteriaceae bacterium]|nr:DUF4249 family protein [Flavobacteriaceae bacterium]
MKKCVYYFSILAVLVTMASCEDVIEVDLPTEDPRLIIDALIRVDTLQTTTLVSVKVSQTNSFFESLPPANLQQITLVNLDFPLGGTDPPVLNEEQAGTGIYTKLFPTEYLTQGRLFLQVDFEDKFFVASAQFVPTVPIDTIEIGEDILFDEDDTEIIVTFTDNPDRDDYNLFDFDFGDFLVTEDEFYQGQQFTFSYFYDKLLMVGDKVEISIMGIDEGFAKYMNKLIEQSQGDFGSSETPSITVRGNFINATQIDNDGTFDNTNDPNNFALGYFAVVQEFKQTIIIE